MGASFSFSFSLFSYVGVYVNAFILHSPSVLSNNLNSQCEH
jgi:hypothetical protein